MVYPKIAHHLLFGQEKKISDLRLSWCTNNPKERGISCIEICLSVNNLHSQHILQDILAFLFDLVSRGFLMYMQLLHLDRFLWRTGHLHNRPSDSCYVARSRWKSLRAINEQNEKSDVIDKKNKYENTVINFGNLKTFFKGLQNLLTIFQPEWNLKIILYHYLSFFLSIQTTASIWRENTPRNLSTDGNYMFRHENSFFKAKLEKNREL